MNELKENPNFGKVIQKCWVDDDFRKNLLENPKLTLMHEGVKVPENMEVRFYENSDSVLHIMLPEKPKKVGVEKTDIEKAINAPIRNGVWRVGNKGADNYCECCGDDMGLS